MNFSQKFFLGILGTMLLTSLGGFSVHAVDRYDCSRFNNNPGQCKLSGKCKLSEDENSCVVKYVVTGGGHEYKNCEASGLTADAKRKCNSYNSSARLLASGKCGQDPLNLSPSEEATLTSQCKIALENVNNYQDIETVNSTCVSQFPDDVTAQKKCRKAQYKCDEISDTSIVNSCAAGTLIEADCESLSGVNKRKCTAAAKKIAKATVLEEKALSKHGEAYDEYFSAYSGPVFTGMGLESGARQAKQHLTSSISKERDIKTLALGWVRFGLSLTAILAVIALIWAGSLYITDFGDGERQGKAKKIIMFVAIGVVVIFGAYAIVNTIMQAQFG